MKYLFSILLLITVSNISKAQSWKQYPYIPSNKSLISFPKDEGFHPDEPIEWWYTVAHLRGKTTGKNYTIMLTYFYRDTLGYDGFRILNISDETNHRFFDDTRPCLYTVLDTNHLEIEANILTHNESWKTSRDSMGNLIPFEYDIHAETKRGVLDLHYSANKRPLILADTGYLNQGIVNYTYYYSQTGISVTGNLSFLGVSEEIEGEAWIDRQYGSFNPYTGEAYEWMCLRLSNGMDINLWNIFTKDLKIPDTSTYKVMGVYINDSKSITLSDFELQRTGFQSLPREGNIYASEFRLLCDSLDIDLKIKATNDISEVRRPFYFYEGPVEIEGVVEGSIVTGVGFAELLHQYQHPKIELIKPTDIWDLSQPIQWKLTNPDDGRQVTYDIAVRYDNDSIYSNIASDIESNQYLWDGSGYSLDSLLWIRISSYSIDSFLSDSIYSQVAFPIITPTSILQLNSKIKLNPNPSRDKLHILNLEGNVTYTYNIYNQFGSIISSSGIFHNDEIDISHLQSGFYFLKLKNGIKFKVLNFIKQ